MEEYFLVHWEICFFDEWNVPIEAECLSLSLSLTKSGLIENGMSISSRRKTSFSMKYMKNEKNQVKKIGFKYLYNIMLNSQSIYFGLGLYRICLVFFWLTFPFSLSLGLLVNVCLVYKQNRNSVAGCINNSWSIHRTFAVFYDLESFFLSQKLSSFIIELLFLLAYEKNSLQVYAVMTFLAPHFCAMSKLSPNV